MLHGTSLYLQGITAGKGKSVTEGFLFERPKVILVIKTSINVIPREKILAFVIQSPGAKDGQPP